MGRPRVTTRRFDAARYLTTDEDVVAYASKVKGMNSSNALTGGLLGTALLVVLVVAASSGSSY